MESLKLAAERCYAQADIEEPASQIDLAEIHENFAHEELMAYEALGLCGQGKGGEFLDSGTTAWTG